MLAEYLSTLATRYTYERAKRFTGSEFARFVVHDIPMEANKILTFWPFELKVKSSVGQGGWAGVPWLAFFDPLITETATRGFYVVFLINADAQTFILSLNQGTTEIYDEFKKTAGLRVLKRRAKDMADRIPDFAKAFDTSPIELGSNSDLAEGYEAGHSFGRTYKAGSISNDDLLKDLQTMLFSYEELINRGGLTPSDQMYQEAGSKEIEETRKYVLSRRIERSPKVRKQVLAKRKPICEACQFEPFRHYGYEGKNEKVPLDVHHAKPLFGLEEGETRRYKVPDDFLVLCPTCHRMIHKQDDTTDIELLRSKVKFIHALKLP